MNNLAEAIEKSHKGVYVRDDGEMREEWCGCFGFTSQFNESLQRFLDGHDYKFYQAAVRCGEGDELDDGIKFSIREDASGRNGVDAQKKISRASGIPLDDIADTPTQYIEAGLWESDEGEEMMIEYEADCTMELVEASMENPWHPCPHCHEPVDPNSLDRCEGCTMVEIGAMQ